MRAKIRLSAKEASELADNIEQNGGDADNLRAAIKDGNPKKGDGNPKKVDMDDEEHILWLRSQSTIEKGKGLECVVCHQKFDELISGTCEACFREWALTIKRRPPMQKLL